MGFSTNDVETATSSGTQGGEKKSYIIDTSVLLSDPNAIFKFKDNDVIISIVVISELEKKRNDLELGYFARKALQAIERLRVENGTLDKPINLPGGGRLHIDTSVSDDNLPEALKNGSNDSFILSVANKTSLRSNAVVVSKDLPLRILASTIGIQAETYRAEASLSDGWSGIEEVEIEYDLLADLFAEDSVEWRRDVQPPINTGVVFKSGTSSALAVYVGDDVYSLIEDTEVFGVSGRSAEQKIAISHLLAKDVGIVSIGGRAGTGKSALALLAGLEGVFETQEYKKILVFRPIYAVGGQELGFLPGDHDEKMNPWAQAVYDTLGSVVSDNVIEEIKARNLIEVLPLTHIRGRSLHDAFVIVDEAQSLERNVLLTVLSRIGKNSKVVLTHDVAQRDNLHVGRYDGVMAVIEALKNRNLFAHITLRKTERSAISELVSNLLDF